MTINSKSVKGIKKPNQILTVPEIKLLKRLNLVAFNVLRRKPDDFVEYVFKKKVNHTITKVINTEIRVQQSKDKKKILDNMIDENRANGNNFYIASWHADSASDHAPYQGLIYVDKNAKLSDDDRAYLRNHKVMSIQAVTSKPVWFVTRPYCRHYFVPTNGTNLLNGNYTVPTATVGDRRLATEPTANVSLKYYEDRLRLLKQLYNVYPTDFIKNKILKTKVLIAKWKQLI